MHDIPHVCINKNNNKHRERKKEKNCTHTSTQGSSKLSHICVPLNYLGKTKGMVPSKSHAQIEVGIQVCKSL